MSMLSAYLDNFGEITVWINRNFYGGKSDEFSLVGEHGKSYDLIVRGLEEHEQVVKYELTAPADMIFGTEYFVRESHGMMTPLVYRLITHTEQFNQLFDYDGDDLGSTYTRTHTDFCAWAPTASDVIVRITEATGIRSFAMKRCEKGVWRVRVKGDLKRATYVYLVKRNGTYVQTLDPYAYSCNGNSFESAVIDLNELKSISNVPTKGFVSGTDAIIYETSVRDMTISPLSETSEHGTYKALSQENTSYNGFPTGLSYLASLGMTHVQLLPVGDFKTVDEFHPLKNYNWGYDPVQYLALEGSYSSNPDEPYTRMKEFKELVAKFHEHDLRVNLDVVFNHVYDVDTSPFNCLCPFYYFRYNVSGFLTNGSYCGNDYASDQPMARRYLVHVIEQWMKIYDVDGFRFDLMGILDTTTMNTIRESALAIKKDAMIYGEGWDMPTLLEHRHKACLTNQDLMPGIGHFNDYFRDIIKGKTSDDQKYEKGYATGDLEKAFGTLSALSANVLNEPYFMRFTQPDKCINGLETHDNHTLWDKMHFCCNNDSREIRKARQKLMIAMTLVSQGIPFLHGGIEFCATKGDCGNSYNAGDGINEMNWQRAIYYKDVIEYTKKAIALRKKYIAFRLHTSEEIAHHLRLSVADGGMIFYDIDYSDATTKTNLVRVIINPSQEYKVFTYEPGWKIVFDSQGEEREEKTDTIEVPGLSLIVCVR